MVGFVPLFFYEISRNVAFVWLRHFYDDWFCFVKKFQWRSVLFGYDISMTVGFVPLFSYEILRKVGLVLLRDFYDGRFCSVTRFQWRSVLFGYDTSMTVGFQCQMGFIHYKISMTVSFIQIWHLNDGRFYSFVLLRDFKESRFCSVTRFLWWSDLFCYEISMMNGFIRLWDLNDGRFSVSNGFFSLRDFSDG